MIISRLQIKKTTQASYWSNSICYTSNLSPNAMSTKTPFSNPKKAVGMKLRALRNHEFRILQGKIWKSPANKTRITRKSGPKKGKSKMQKLQRGEVTMGRNPFGDPRPSVCLEIQSYDKKSCRTECKLFVFNDFCLFIPGSCQKTGIFYPCFRPQKREFFTLR